MRCRKFKDYNISALGMGGIRYITVPDDPNHVDREKGFAVIDEAVKRGINYFDTAQIYMEGDSETFLGEALAKYPRDSYILATKYNSKPGIDIETVFNEQLKRLKTDYIDFYLLHGLDSISFSAYTDKNRDDIVFIRRKKEEGAVRNIGFSSHASPEMLERFLDFYDGYDMALIQINFLDWTLLDSKRQYEILTEHNIPVWVMEPLKGGRLIGKVHKAAELLKSAAPDKTMTSWAFRFLMGLPNVYTVLSGMNTPEQVAENAEIFNSMQPLDGNELELLEKAASLVIDELGIPCSSCRYCCSTCPAELDIPLLIQAYNEQNISGAAWRFGKLDSITGPDKCLDCGVCRNHCPQNIDIPLVMKNFAEKLN